MGGRLLEREGGAKSASGCELVAKQRRDSLRQAGLGERVDGIAHARGQFCECAEDAHGPRLKLLAQLLCKSSRVRCNGIISNNFAHTRAREALLHGLAIKACVCCRESSSE